MLSHDSLIANNINMGDCFFSSKVVMHAAVLRVVTKNSLLIGGLSDDDLTVFVSRQVASHAG